MHILQPHIIYGDVSYFVIVVEESTKERNQLYGKVIFCHMPWKTQLSLSLSCLCEVCGQILGEYLYEIVQSLILYFHHHTICNRRLNHMWMRYYPLLKGIIDTIINIWKKFKVLQMTKNNYIFKLSVTVLKFWNN